MTQEEVAARPPTDSEEALRTIEQMTSVGPPSRPGKPVPGSTWYDLLVRVNSLARLALGEARGTASASESTDARLREELKEARADNARQAETLRRTLAAERELDREKQRNTRLKEAARRLLQDVGDCETWLGTEGVAAGKTVHSSTVSGRWLEDKCPPCVLRRLSGEAAAVTGTTSDKSSLPHPGSPDGT